MKKRSVIFLFLLLALPLAIFAFLRVFGKNRFDLPVMYLTSAEWPEACARPSQWPFKVDAGVIPDGATRPVLVLFSSLPPESAQRLPVEIDTSSVMVITGKEPCRLGASVTDAAVLLDAARQVRGVYKNLGRDEMDRLIMESKILLNDY